MLETIKIAVASAVKQLFQLSVDPHVSVPEEQFGDVATNVAMQITKQVGKNPTEIAEQLADKLREQPGIKEVSIAGPGFLNIRMSDKLLIQSALDEPVKIMSGKKILVEYSDPNPFKPLHAGHLYTTLVGDVLARLVENAGADTVRLNFGGDVGMHVGKTMWAILKKLNGEDLGAVTSIPVEKLGSWMGERYVEGNNAYQDSVQSQSEIKLLNKRVYQIHSEGDYDSNFAQIYWYLREASYGLFKKLYKELGVVQFDRFIPESEVAAPGLAAVGEHIGKVFNESDGAIVFEGEAFGLHTRVFINNEGLPTYEAKDVGLALTKWQDYHFDESIIITGSEQAQYMEVVLKAIEQFAPEAALKTRHLTHGIVKLSGGVKMSSRKGNILSAFDILQVAREAGKASGQAEKESVVLAAVKYALVKNRIGGDIVYDPKESIATEGNSGPYLQYAHARARSILRKAKAKANATAEIESEGSVPINLTTKISNLEDGERKLLRTLAEYPDVITKATEDLAPHLVCTYLYELAQEFNRFYEQNKVLGDKRQETRIALVSQYSHTLKKGLALLGIDAPEVM